MIRISKWLAGAAATVAIALGSADAEAQRGRPGGDSSGRPDPREMFERIDKNNDGELSKDERDGLPSFIKDRIKGADEDKNGSLTKEEIRAFFTDDIIRFFENQHIYHLESNGEALIIFDKIKLARTDETIAFIEYGQELANLLGGKTP